MNRKMPDTSLIKDYLKDKHIILPLCISIILVISIYINELVIFIFPIVPIIYGWKTRNLLGSVIMGMLPIMLLFLNLHITNLDNYTPEQLRYMLTYISKLMVIGGINGYLVAKLSKKYSIPMLIIGSFMWYTLFITGID
jgi:hypothetical protein